jgi:hypothetical protein
MQKVNSQPCFNCGHVSDHVTSTINNQKIKENDAIVCFYCGAIGKWKKGKIIEVTKIELNIWKLCDPKMYDHILSVSDSIKEMQAAKK